MTRPARIHLRRVGSPPVADSLFEFLARGIADVFKVQVEVHSALTERNGDARALGGGREAEILHSAPDDKVDADALLDALIVTYPDDRSGGSVWTLGVTGFDLAADGRQFVFGEAAVGGAWALVGVARFGIPATPSPRLLARACKESVHELGHLAGLGHCATPGCVMGKAATVADVDRKKSEICGACATWLFATDET